MFGRIGPTEIILILALILLLFGARKLPELARSVGKSVVELKEGLKGSSGSDDSASKDSKPEE